MTYSRFARLLLAPSLAVLLALLLMAVALEQASASTTEREGLDDIAASLVSEDAMEALAGVLADPDASPACKGYADLLLLYAGYLRHMLAYPESRVALSEFAGRIATSLPANQYACENAL